MKFENDYIRIEIEKKELTEEQKEFHRQKRKRQRPYGVTALVLVAAIISVTLYGHYRVPQNENTVPSTESKPDNMTVETGSAAGTDNGAKAASEEEISDLLTNATYVTSTRLATSTKEKYKDKSLYDYAYVNPIEDLGREEPIEVHLDFDPYEMEEIENWREICKIYQTPELTGEIVGSSYDWDEETGILKISPSNYMTNGISTSNLDAEMVNRYDHTEYCLFDRGSGLDWGNVGTLYLAYYYDETTGEKLEKPNVSIITLQAELDDTPILNYAILEDGRPEFTWTSVEGVAEYIVCKVVYDYEKGYDHTMTPLGVTTETRWATEAVEFGTLATANKEFRNYRVSEDNWKNESDYEYYSAEYEPGTVVQWEYNEGQDQGICVIAISEKGTSMISNVYFYSELTPNLPNSLATYTEKENGFARDYEKVEEFPAYDYVTMCDGVTNQKLIDYHTQEASVTPKRIWFTDEEGNYLEGQTLDCLEVPYVVEGTPFSSTMEIIDYNKTNLEADMKLLEDREEQLRKKSGDVGPSAFRGRDFKEAQDEEVQVRQLDDIEIFANSALSEYLAMNMLAGVPAIDLSDFPEAKDTSAVEDAMMEAYYQNPLILGIQAYQIDRKKMILYIAYDEEAAVQAKKQQEIQDKLGEIIGQIITADMTDEEVELAINRYLCDMIVYDDEALVNAQENDFMYVDESFNDSFTAYGALINGKCVCSGYAAAFKLLCDASGLESIVVTGILDGGLSHAWNKIKLENEWQIVDVTNNDTDYIANALLNLPSFAGERVLVEDKDFMSDKLIKQYQGQSEDNEYYHMMEQYYPIEEMAEKLAADLQAAGEATLRTDYDLDDDRFYDITDAVYEIMGDDVDLYGFYWLGVIYLNTTGF